MIHFNPIGVESADDHLFAQEQMHGKIEIILILNSLHKHRNLFRSLRLSSKIIIQNFRYFLEDYFKEHHRLPSGWFNLIHESEESAYPIDFSETRRCVRTLQRQKHLLNINRLQSSTKGFMHQIGWEIMIGLRDQEIGKDPNVSVFRIRQQEIRNQQILIKNQ